MITLCDEETPGGPGWLWAGVGGMGRTFDELLGMGKVAGRRGCCSLWGVHRLYFTPTDEHLDHFQIPVIVIEETIIARLLLSQFHRVCFQQWSTKFCFIHSTLRSSTHPASHLFMHPSTHQSIHPFTLNSPIHPPSHSSTDLIISDPKEDRRLLPSSQEDTQCE